MDIRFLLKIFYKMFSSFAMAYEGVHGELLLHVL